MRNRILSHFQSGTLAEQAAPIATASPTLKLKMDREFSVDMERFFDFSFSFAEALVDLEDRHESPNKITTMQRFLATDSKAQGDELGDIDARWM